MHTLPLFSSLIVCFLININLLYSTDLDNIKIIKKSGKNIYAVSDHKVYTFNHNKPQSVFESKEPITAMLPVNNSFIVCTEKEILFQNPKQLLIKIKHNLAKPKFISLTLSADGKIYVASQMDGVFEIKNDSLVLFHYTFPINSINSTSDTSTWLATNIGLIKTKLLKWKWRR